MKELKQCSDFFSGYQERRKVVLYYADTKELANTYTFKTEEEAETFFQLCLRVGEMVEEVPEKKRAAAHLNFVNESLKNVTYKAVTYQ